MSLFTSASRRHVATMGCIAASLTCINATYAAPAEPAPASPAKYVQMAEEAQPLRQAADTFVARAMAGDRPATLALLSRSLVERIGEPAANKALNGQILPFFMQGREVGGSITIARTTDANGSSGFAFYMWLKPADGGVPKPFTVYAVREQGRAVVANVVPDQLVPNRHQ